MMQAFFYKHLVPARELTLVPEDRSRFRSRVAARAPAANRRTPPARAPSSSSPMAILSEQPVKIPAGGTAEVQIRMPWDRKGEIQDRIERSAGGDRRRQRVVD